MEIKPCPCGQTPTKLHIVDRTLKYPRVLGDCCNEWEIEYRGNYNNDHAENERLALVAWNESTRGWE